MRSKILRSICLCASLFLAGCGGGNSGGNGGDYGGGDLPPTEYLVGVTVTGLVGSGLQLKNGVDTLSVTADGAATFPTRLPSGSSYAVTVLSHPTVPAQRCEVAHGNGTIANGDVTGITVHCLTSTAARFAYAVNYGGGSISIYNVDAASGQLRMRGYAKAGAGPFMAAHDPAGRFSYVLNSGLDPADLRVLLAFPSISVFAHDNVNGDLREVEGGPFVTSFGLLDANSLTVHPSGKFLYVATDSGNIFQWSVGPNGRLTEIDEPVSSGRFPTRLVFDAPAHFAYVTHAERDSAGIFVYEINEATGALEERESLRKQFAARDLRSSNLVFHPRGKFVYVVNQEFELNPGSLTAFVADSTTGELTAVPGQPLQLPVNAAFAPVFDPSGKFVYVLAFGATGSPGSIAAFSIDATTGALTALAGSPYATGFNPGSLAFTPSGDFLYVANRASQPSGGPTGNPSDPGSISTFRIDRGSGVLTAIGGVDTLQPAPFVATVDPSGRYLYAASGHGDRIHAYQIDAAGGLTPLAQGAAIRAGSQPVSIDTFVSPTVATPAVFVPKFAYLSDIGGHSLFSYTADADSGLLQLSGTIPAGGNSPRALAPSADGRFLYSAELSGTASTYSIEAATGTLSASDAGTISAGDTPVAIATDPSNRFVYVANYEDSTVMPYRRNVASGVLSANGDAIPTVAGPVSITADPTGRNLYVMSESHVQVFSIDAKTGELRAASTDDRGVTSLVGGIGVQLAVEPGGKFLYVVSFQGLIEIYPIDSRNGALGSVSTKQIDPLSLSLTIDPTGRFLYTAGLSPSSISAFSIAQETGMLTALDRTTLAVEPRQVVADFSGKYLWAVLFDSSIATFAVDQSSGALTAIASTPGSAARAASISSMVSVGTVQ